MALHSLVFLLVLYVCSFAPASGMEPLALLATQPVWQAAQPITVNVDYDGLFLLALATSA